MNSRLISLIIFVTIIIIGLLRMLIHRTTMLKSLKFADEFYAKLNDYAKSGGKDEVAYVWMMRNTNKMQDDLGEQGILSSYKPPGANYLLRNVPIITNLLPQLHAFANDEWLCSRPVTAELHTSIRDAILRHTGTLAQEIEDIGKSTRNPISLFQYGVKSILLIPFDLLANFGLFSPSANQRVNQSFIAKVLIGIVSLVGFLSGLVTIVVGWKAFAEVTERIFKQVCL